MNNHPDILTSLILLVWFLGAIKTFNDTAPKQTHEPGRQILISGKAVPLNFGYDVEVPEDTRHNL